MDLIEILDRILKTKNQMRDILGETDNISRYPIAIHNNIAVKYNEGYVKGYYDRYLELNDDEYWVSGPMPIYEYGVDATYYEEYTTEVLTDIMRDCLNYRLGMKDELEIDSDEFVTYPDYLRDKIDSVYDIGYADGMDQADEDYEGNEDVDDPVITNTRNKIVITSDQEDVRIKYKINNDGLEYEYNSPIIISEDCTIYAKALIGRSTSNWVSENCVYDPDGFISFVSAPAIKQEGNLIYLSTSLNNCLIEYKIDSGPWTIYQYPISVTVNDSILYCRAIRNGEYSVIIAQPISHSSSLTRPANVTCTIEDIGTKRIINLSCSTTGSSIKYAINQMTGDWFTYSQPVEEFSEHFVVYAYAIKDGEESPNRLFWKFDKNENNTIPQPVYFTNNGTTLIMSCVTENSVIMYRYGNIGSFINGGSNYVVISPADGSTIQAYSILNGYTSSISEHTFRKNQDFTVSKPYAWLDDNNYIIIQSPDIVYYTTDGNDPRGGAMYNESNPIGPITITTTLKCIAFSNGQYSELAVYTFTPGGSNVQPGGGYSNEIPSSLDGDYFWMYGCERITWAGTSLSYWTGIGWATVNSSIRFEPNKKTYFYGKNVTEFKPVGGNPTIGGDILSLVNGQNFQTTISTSGNFRGLFSGSSIVNGADLVLRLDNLSKGCYESMFEGCYSLISAPVLNAAKFNGTGVYKGMFKGCTSLVNPPVLNCTSLSANCYESMFEGCTSLNTKGFILPAENLFDGCYKAMFKGCTSLKDAPILPATVLAGSCYESMFEGCTKLEKSPDLPCEYIGGKVDCYKKMFYHCSNLMNIKALFKDKPTGNFSSYWVEGVASWGIFSKNVDAQWTNTGVHAVPVGWTVQNVAAVGRINDIIYNPYTGKVRITASTNDTIWYSIDTPTFSKTTWREYTEEFDLYTSCTVYAVCENAEGVLGSIYHKSIQVSYPALVASIYDGKVSISAGGFNYASIRYGFTSTEGGTPGSYEVYSEPFILEYDTWIVMRGYVNGQANYVTETRQYLIPSLSAPYFDPQPNLDNNKTYLYIKYPNTSILKEIRYSLNDSEHINTLYSYGNPIIVEWYNDDTDKVYYAKALVTFNGSDVWTSTASITLKKGGNNIGVTLLVPNLWQPQPGNIWYVEYDSKQYTEWPDTFTTTSIGYRLGQGGNTRVYVDGINLRDIEPLPLSSGNIDVYVWSFSGNTKSSENHYQKWLDINEGSTVPNTPTVRFGKYSDHYNVFVDNNTVLGPYDTIVNYYWMEEPSEWTADALTDGDIRDKIGKWVQVSDQGDPISNYIVKARFKAKSVIWWNSTGSNESVVSDWYDFTNDFAVTSIPNPTGAVVKENGHNVLYLYTTMNINEVYDLQFYIENTKWASGVADTHMYDNWSVLYIYGTPLNDYLGEGTIHIKYSSHGLTSEEYIINFYDPDVVTGLVEPTISNPIDMNGGRHKIMITNEINDMVQLQFRIVDTVWAGGVTDRTQYDNWRVTFTTGIVLNEYLISGTIQARTWDGQEYSEISAKHFEFEYNGIPNPAISFVDKGTRHEILVSNKNKYVTSYYRWDNESSYSVALKYGNSIPGSRLSGYAYAYSQLDTDKSSTVVSYFDSGISTTYAPPVITVVPNADGITYNMTITSSANLPRIKWKIDPTDWDGRQTSANVYGKQYADDWMLESKPVSLNLSQYLKSGTIQAFVTNSTSHSVNEVGVDSSEVTTYSFVNGHYSS